MQLWCPRERARMHLTHVFSGESARRSIARTEGRADMSESLIDLKGRVVIVAGAAGGGIGTHATKLAARAGATVIAVSRSTAKLDKDIAPLAKQGLSVVPVAADVSTDEGVATALD